MKMELPVAVVLIACGSLLWWAHGFEANPNAHDAGNQAKLSVSPTNQPVPDSIPSAINGPISDPNALASNVQQATFQSELPATSSPNQNANDQTANDLASRRLLRDAAQQLFNSPPLQTRARMQINKFNQSMVVAGRYLQQGQGTRRARFDFSYNDADTRFQVMQICDGRFFYSLSSINDKSSLEFVDLDALANASTKELSFSAGPSGWLSTGGVPSLLEHLSVAFDFEPSTSSELSGVPMVTIRGKWNPQALKTMLMGQVNPAIFTTQNGTIDWSKLPEQIPHSVEIMLGTDSFLKLFPYRVQFEQFVRPEDRKQTDQNWISRPTLTLELFEVTKVADIPLSDFQINTDQLEPINATEKYLIRVKEFEHQQSVQLSEQQAQKTSAAGSTNQSARVPAIPQPNQK